MSDLFYSQASSRCGFPGCTTSIRNLPNASLSISSSSLEGALPRHASTAVIASLPWTTAARTNLHEPVRLALETCQVWQFPLPAHKPRRGFKFSPFHLVSDLDSLSLHPTMLASPNSDAKDHKKTTVPVSSPPTSGYVGWSKLEKSATWELYGEMSVMPCGESHWVIICQVGARVSKVRKRREDGERPRERETRTRLSTYSTQSSASLSFSLLSTHTKAASLSKVFVNVSYSR
jgi:hypothetical protein